MAQHGVLLSCKDARFTRSGKYSAWLSKAKQDGARTKFLSSSVKRYFTIDFETQAFYYANSGSNKDIKAFIPFKDIVEVITTEDTSWQQQQQQQQAPRGLRRSLSSSMLRRGQPNPEDFNFTVVTTERRLELVAESAADQTAWMTALNAARLIGKGESHAGTTKRCTNSPPSSSSTPSSASSSTLAGDGSVSSYAECSSEASSEALAGRPASESGPSAVGTPRQDEAPAPHPAQGTDAAEATSAAAADGLAASKGSLNAEDFGFDDDDDDDDDEEAPELCAAPASQKARLAAGAGCQAPAPESLPAARQGDGADAETEEATISEEEAARIAADLSLLKRPVQGACVARVAARAAVAAEPSADINDRHDTDEADADMSPGRKSRIAADLNLLKRPPPPAKQFAEAPPAAQCAMHGDADVDAGQAARIAADLALLGKVPRPGWQPQRAGAQ